MLIKVDDEPYELEETDAGYMATLEAAANTARLLESAGLELELSDDDLDDAAETARQAARAPHVLQQQNSIRAVTKKTPAALLLTEKILKDFGHQVVQEAAQVRHMVVNKLIQETENPDARIRVKALELLGKVSDVGLFTEKQEITITHQTSDDLRQRLRRKLEHLIDVTPQEGVEDADFEEIGSEEDEK